MRCLLRLSAFFGGVLASGYAYAAPMTVVDARGAGLKPGMRVESASRIQLKDGERVTLIGIDGRAVTLRGSYSGVIAASAGSTQNPRAALAALIATRNDRASQVGAVRSGANAAPLPDPWLIDISRPGARCIREGETPIWWRPDASVESVFTVYPLDRSWRADFVWQQGQAQMRAPNLAKLDGVKTFLIHMPGQDNAISINTIPADVTDPLVLSSWMLEKACVQQADAYFRQIQADLDAQNGSQAATLALGRNTSPTEQSSEPQATRVPE